MDADNWSTLPGDLLVDIFRRLDVSAVIRCAAVCRPWQHAIIDNASCLRPRPDRFLPGLLLGFVEKHLRSRRHLPWLLQYVPAWSSSTLPAFHLPATGASVDGRLYSDLLSSRDGFLLLGQDDGTTESLCLCTATALTGGVCRVLPAAEFDGNPSQRCMYVLATGYDVVVDDGDETAVWILAVNLLQQDAKDGVTYQIFSSTSGAWGPVKRSAKFPADVAFVRTSPRSSSGSVVVCHGAVSWFVSVSGNAAVNGRRRTRLCMFSMDLRTERTWTTELPDLGTVETSFVLAVSEDDGQLCLVQMMASSHKMEVWVVGGDGRWTLRRRIGDVQKLLTDCPSMGDMRLSGFCPRSGYLFGTGTGMDDDRKLHHHFVIGVDGSSPRLIGSVESSRFTSRFPYEMDSSTYISSYLSNMKYLPTAADDLPSPMETARRLARSTEEVLEMRQSSLVSSSSKRGEVPLMKRMRFLEPSASSSSAAKRSYESYCKG